jgi:TonB family protein
MMIQHPNQLSLVHFESIEYPRLAWQARIDGEVKIEIHVASDGSVSSASATSGHQLLQKAASDNVKKWVFLSNHESNLEIIYDFKLERPESSSQHATKAIVDLHTRRVVVICNLPAFST